MLRAMGLRALCAVLLCSTLAAAAAAQAPLDAQLDGLIPMLMRERRIVGVAPRRQQSAVRLDRAAELRYVIAQHFAETAGFEEVALHVDD